MSEGAPAIRCPHDDATLDLVMSAWVVVTHPDGLTSGPSYRCRACGRDYAVRSDDTSAVIEELRRNTIAADRSPDSERNRKAFFSSESTSNPVE